MKKNKILLLSLCLFSCANNNSIISSESMFSEEISSNIISEESSLSSSKGNAFSLDLNSKDTSYSEIETTSILSKDEIYEILMGTYLNDGEVSKATFRTYNIQKSYYQKQEYTSYSYLNDVNLSYGTSTHTYLDTYEKLSSKYIEQITYENNELITIKKFESSFANTATKVKMDESTKKAALNLGQGLKAYAIFEEFAKKENAYIESEITEDKIYISILFAEEMRDDGYAYGGGMEINLDAAYNVQDFFFGEGYYFYGDMSSVSSLRKHGPDAYAGGGYSYEAMDFTYFDKTEYNDELIYKIEDNFITSISFVQEEATFSLDDQYIDLYEYISTSPTGGERVGAPLNNLVFTSSSPAVASVDSHYLDFKSKGETYISVKDIAGNISAEKTIKIIVV